MARWPASWPCDADVDVNAYVDIDVYGNSNGDGNKANGHRHKRKRNRHSNGVSCIVGLPLPDSGMTRTAKTHKGINKPRKNNKTYKQNMLQYVDLDSELQTS